MPLLHAIYNSIISSNSNASKEEEESGLLSPSFATSSSAIRSVMLLKEGLSIHAIQYVSLLQYLNPRPINVSELKYDDYVNVRSNIR